MAVPLLQTHSINCRFGGLNAVQDVSLDIYGGEIFGVIGPNGAGKTTFFNLLSGAIPCTSGKIIFKGREIQSLRPHHVARMGIGRTFQIVRPFLELTVIENVLAAIGAQFCTSFISALGQSRRRAHIEAARTILRRTQLDEYEREMTVNLPLGILRRLEIARALGMRPDLILLDESFSGLSHHEALDLVELIRKLRAGGMTIMMIEHNVKVTMKLCDRIAVLERGEVIAQGKPEEVSSNQRVIEAYLGTDA